MSPSPAAILRLCGWPTESPLDTSNLDTHKAAHTADAGYIAATLLTLQQHLSRRPTALLNPRRPLSDDSNAIYYSKPKPSRCPDHGCPTCALSHTSLPTSGQAPIIILRRFFSTAWPHRATHFRPRALPCPERRHDNLAMQYCPNPICTICNLANARPKHQPSPLRRLLFSRPSEAFRTICDYAYLRLRRRELPLALSQANSESDHKLITSAHRDVIQRISTGILGLRFVYDTRGTLRQLPSAPPALAFWLWPAASRQTIRDGGRLGITYNQSQPTSHSNAPDADTLSIEATCQELFGNQILQPTTLHHKPQGLFTVPKKDPSALHRMIINQKLGGANPMCASLFSYFRDPVHALLSEAHGPSGYDSNTDYKDHFHTFKLHPEDRPHAIVKPPQTPNTLAPCLE